MSNEDEIDFTLEDGTVLNVQVLKDKEGNKRYRFNDPSGVYNPVVYSPGNIDKPNDAVDGGQKSIIDQFSKTL